MSIIGDLSRWPLVFARWDGDQTVDDVERHIARMEEIHRRKQPWVSLNYMKQYSRDPAVIRRVARWMRETGPMTRRYCAGVALVSPSGGFRFFLSSVFLISPLPCPHDVFGNYDDALSYLRNKLSDVGVSLPCADAPWSDVPRNAAR
jgi:hypothetical protein